MGYSTLVTHEGTLNALAREGCRHFEPLGYINKDFIIFCMIGWLSTHAQAPFMR
jgi:hypothetical protein